MLGISKYTNFSDLTDKESLRLLELATQKVKAENNVMLDVIFCSCCQLPIYKDDVYLGEHNGSINILCGLCYFPKNLDMAHFSDLGVLIFAPDLSQELINSLALISYYVKNESKGNQDLIDLVSDVDDLMLRRSEVLNTGVCQGSSNPSIMCQFLYMLDEQEYNNRGDMLSSVRLFPSERLASRQLVYLSTNVLKKYHPSKWVGLVQAMEREISLSSNP